MNKRSFLTSLLKGALVLALCFSCLYAGSASARKTQQSGIELKKDCIKAAIRGIELEIDRYQKWIDMRKSDKVNDSDLPELEAKMKELKVDLEKYQQMNLDDYTLPKAINLTAWVREKPTENSILYIEEMSKSGPWYQLTGIVGGKYSALKVNVKYQIVFYPVYQRSYFNMDSWYVYIAEF